MGLWLAYGAVVVLCVLAAWLGLTGGKSGA